MSAIVRFFNDLLQDSCQFSDVLIKTGRFVTVRRPMGWEVTDYRPTEGDINGFFAVIDNHYQNALANGEQIERSFFLPNTSIRVRASLFSSDSKRIKTAILRLVPTQIPSVNDLNLPLFVSNFAKAKSGLVLVSGATGSGKTTTIASLINEINMKERKHILTLEEPIEYTHNQMESVITQREIGADTKSFILGLEAAMRHRPDVIFVGEIRDRDTAEACIRAAESGHLVFATTHAKSAIGGISKILSFFGDHSTAQAMALSHCFVGAVYQRLLASKDGQRFVMASEVISGTDPIVARNIATPASYSSIDEALNGAGGLQGGMSFNISLKDLVDRGEIEPVSAIAAANHPEKMRQLLTQGR